MYFGKRASISTISKYSFESESILRASLPVRATCTDISSSAQAASINLKYSSNLLKMSSAFYKAQVHNKTVRQTKTTKISLFT